MTAKPLALTHPEPHDPGALAYWPTPAWVTQLLLQVHPPQTDVVVEPSAGEGAIARELIRAGYSHVMAVELRYECHAALDDDAVCMTLMCPYSWLDVDIRHMPKRSAIVGNPPYTPARVMLAHVAHCLDAYRAGVVDYVALLLPIAFLHSSERYPFNALNPPDCYYPLAERPSFSGDGSGGTRDVAWYVWDRHVRREQRIKVLSKEMLR